MHYKISTVIVLLLFASLTMRAQETQDAALSMTWEVGQPGRDGDGRVDVDKNEKLVVWGHLTDAQMGSIPFGCEKVLLYGQLEPGPPHLIAEVERQESSPGLMISLRLSDYEHRLQGLGVSGYGTSFTGGTKFYLHPTGVTYTDPDGNDVPHTAGKDTWFQFRLN